jgi:hypothetical protein
MAIPSTALDYLSAITQKRIIPFMVDQVTQTNTLMNLLIQNASFIDGGEYITQPIMTSLPTDAVVAYTGADILPNNFQVNEQGAVFDWKFYAISVDIVGQDEVKNDGVAAAINLVTTRMKEADIALRDRLGSDLQGDGSADGGKAFLGLKAAVDDGSTVDVYGGVSRAAFPVWKSYVNSNGGVARALSIGLIDRAFQNTSMDSDTPNMLVGTRGIVTKFTQLLQPLQRFQSGEVAVAGYKNVFYRGYPLISDDHVQKTPVEKLWGLNTKYLQMYFKKGRFFKWRPFQTQSNQDVVSGKIMLAMCFINSRPASQFLITDINSSL